MQVLEQLENNILLRPLTLYNGPDARAYVPLDQAIERHRDNQTILLRRHRLKANSHDVRDVAARIHPCGAKTFC